MSETSAKTSKVARNCVRYLLWDVKCLKDGQRTFLKNLDNKGAISICRDHENAMEVMVEGTRSVHIEKLLRERNISFDVTGTDIGPMPTRVRGRSPCPAMLTPRTTTPKTNTDNGTLEVRLFGRGPCPATPSPRAPTPKMRRTLDWDDFYPLYMITNWMHNLEKLYPSTCTVSAIGKSIEGRDLSMLKISNSDASNTGVWLDGGIHAREWISISVVTFIADYIAINFNKLPESITNKDWYFLPVVNPDGYHHTLTHDRQWRKSRARFGNTIVGVDLNRNFGHSWGVNGDISSSGDPNHNNYRGQDAFSEPETAAVKDLILYSGTPFKIFLTFHAYSEVISFPWCYTSDPCPDYVNLLEGGAVMAKAMYETTGRMYRVGNFKDIMYAATGTSIDWSYGTARIPFSYLVELRSKEHKFMLPKNEIYECGREALSAVLALAQFVETRKCLNCTVFENRNK